MELPLADRRRCPGASRGGEPDRFDRVEPVGGRELRPGPGPVRDHWLAGSVGEFLWLARQNPQLGAGLAEPIAALRSLGSADGEEPAR